MPPLFGDDLLSQLVLALCKLLQCFDGVFDHVLAPRISGARQDGLNRIPREVVLELSTAKLRAIIREDLQRKSKLQGHARQVLDQLVRFGGGAQAFDNQPA